MFSRRSESKKKKKKGSNCLVNRKIGYLTAIELEQTGTTHFDNGFDVWTKEMHNLCVWCLWVCVFVWSVIVWPSGLQSCRKMAKAFHDLFDCTRITHDNLRYPLKAQRSMPTNSKESTNVIHEHFKFEIAINLKVNFRFVEMATCHFSNFSNHDRTNEEFGESIRIRRLKSICIA